MRILVLDDDPIVLSAIRHQTSINYEKHEFCFCESFDEYIMNYKDCLFDVLLFDISLPQKSGIELATQMIQENPQAEVIYFTGYPLKYCEEIFEGVKPFGYLKKPMNYNKLETLLQRIEAKKEAAKPQLLVKYHGAQITLDPSSVQWLESTGRTIRIHCKDRQITVYSKLCALEAQLPGFIRCHTSYLVNPDFICSMRGLQFHTNENDIIIPISRKYLKEARNKYFKIKGNFND